MRKVLLQCCMKENLKLHNLASMRSRRFKGSITRGLWSRRFKGIKCLCQRYSNNTVDCRAQSRKSFCSAHCLYSINWNSSERCMSLSIQFITNLIFIYLRVMISRHGFATCEQAYIWNQGHGGPSQHPGRLRLRPDSAGPRQDPEDRTGETLRHRLDLQPEILELFQQEELPLRAAQALTDHLGTRNSQESRRPSETRAAQKRQQPGSHSMGSRSEIGVYFLHELACLNCMHC